MFLISGLFKRFNGVDDAMQKEDKWKKKAKKIRFSCVSVESDYIIFLCFGI